MTRLQQFDLEVKGVIKNSIHMNMPEPKMIEASFCSDLANEFFSYSWSDFKIASGKIPAAKWISDHNLEICKKSEATCLLRTGERCPDTGYWFIGKFKNFWLRPLRISANNI